MVLKAAMAHEIFLGLCQEIVYDPGFMAELGEKRLPIKQRRYVVADSFYYRRNLAKNR